ncbi:MAG: glycoside hydrolase family 127 protein [Bacteroidaceae bacterium]|nr:glycoside hydrolase family 127 protein [Bacteroidaceae bacterium]
MKKKLTLTVIFSASLLASLIPLQSLGQGITDTKNSKMAVVNAVPLDATVWTDGFWAERFNVFSKVSVQDMWKTWQSDKANGFQNFLVASGKKEGRHRGPAFHDGDMYKWFESVVAVYAITKDPELLKIMDEFVDAVIKSQREDGYINTTVTIVELNERKKIADVGNDNTVVGTATGSGKDGAFGNRLNFETYNMGHLITTAILYHRVTGKTDLLDCAKRAADFMYNYWKKDPTTMAYNSICPSHYMGMAELFRETGEQKYKDLAEAFINIRDSIKDGTDDNQDRIPFRQQYNAMGHSVRANYLYAGVADLYLETGEEQLLKNLQSIWNDLTYRKMYINGACGALYDGTSPDGTDYKPDNVQKVHQSYGRPYQLPHSTAHNETCANIGNMLFNWRMYLANRSTKHIDIVENCFYNSILPGISLSGTDYFYVNPLRLDQDLPYTLRWPKERKSYISCFCCPPNTLRTLCEVQNYAYAVSPSRIDVNLYGSNSFNVNLQEIGEVSLSQKTDYPWNGDIKIIVEKVKSKKPFTIAPRIPEWADGAVILVNGTPVQLPTKTQGDYAVINRVWKKSDVISISMPMTAKLIESHPLVEENRGQVCVQRGPLLYCLESPDLNGIDMNDITIPADAQFNAVEMTIAGSRVVALETEAYVRQQSDWSNTLYRELSRNEKKQKVRLIPYYAWGNRGKSDMTVWMPVRY